MNYPSSRVARAIISNEIVFGICDVRTIYIGREYREVWEAVSIEISSRAHPDSEIAAMMGKVFQLGRWLGWKTFCGSEIDMTASTPTVP